MRMYLQPNGTTILDELGVAVVGITITTVPDGQDDKKYGESQDDKAIRQKATAGYNITRAKYTREPARTFSIGWTKAAHETKLIIEQLSIDTSTGSVPFYWLNKIDNEVVKVRLAAPPTFKYAGIGPTKLWDILVTLEEV